MSAAQATLQQILAELANSGAATAPVTAELQRLGGLRTSVVTANAASLRVLGGEVAAAVTQSSNLVREARDQIAIAQAASSEALATAAAVSRSAVQAALDSLTRVTLHFASAEEEAEYRKREDERRAYIAAQHGKQTPEGDLNAAGGAIGQMVDAKEHGASGPEFQQRLDDLIATTEKLREAAKANGVSTEEFDRHLREDLRRILKSKGMSDAEIDARFAANPEPLEAVKAHLSSDEDLAQLRDAAKAIRVEAVEGSQSIAASSEIQSQGGLSDALAKLSLAGIAMSDHPATEEFAHGVTANRVPPAGATRTV